MAKKSSRRKAAAQAQSAFDDKKYEGVRFSATFEYNELTFTRAAEQLFPRGRSAATIVTFLLLVLLVLTALMLENTPVLVVLFVLCLVAMNAATRWSDLQIWYARSTTLAPGDGAERRHVVVCEDEVHVEDESGDDAAYPLSSLRVVYATSDFLVAGFGNKRYVYVPRSALSESRFRDLVGFLDAHAA